MEKRLLIVEELWEQLGFAINKEVKASKERVKKVRALLEKHRGISPGRTVGRAPSEFEFAVNLKPGARLVKQPNRRVLCTL